MNWFKAISERKKKKEKKIESMLKAGYGWAMTKYFYENKTIEEVYNNVEQSKHFEDYDNFDTGIEKAIDKIKEIGEVYEKI